MLLLLQFSIRQPLNYAWMFFGGSFIGIGGLFLIRRKLAELWNLEVCAIFTLRFQLCNCCYSYGGGRIAFIFGMGLPSMDLHGMSGILVHSGHLSANFSAKMAKNWAQIRTLREMLLLLQFSSDSLQTMLGLFRFVWVFVCMFVSTNKLIV